jgi:hypothetical protein
MRFTAEDSHLMKPKDVTIAFKRWIIKASFGELMIFDFQIMGSPSCDLPLETCI